jgi:hypothetical protein
LTDTSTPVPPPARAGGRLSPGFAGRLGLGLGLAFLAVYALIAVAQLQRRGYVYTTDFLSILTGAAIVQSGDPAHLYDPATQATTQAALVRQGGYGLQLLLPFNHPPFEMLLFAGLRAAGLSDPALLLARTLLSLLAIGAAWRALAWGWPIRGRPGQIGALAIFTFFPVVAGLLLGQNTALVLLGWAAGSAAQRRGYPGWAGAAFALLALKPQAAPVLLLALLLGRYGRTLVVTALAALAAVGLTLPILGADWPLRYGALLWQLATSPADAAIDPATMHNWRALATLLLGHNTAATVLTGVLTLISLGLLVGVWWGTAASRPAPGTWGWDRRWAITLLLALLVHPHLQLHDLALALVPGWILAAHARATVDWRLAAWLGLGWALGLIALYRTLPVPLTVLWLAGTAGWLLWQQGRAARAPAPANVV